MADPRPVEPRPDLLDLDAVERVHVVGVGGAGMSAVATVLAGRGHRVSGSDLKERGLERLEADGITVHVGHDPAVVEGVDLVAISSAIPATNIEVARARELGVRIAERSEVLAALTRTRRTIGVAGTHGKTTTSSMLALILVEAGAHPSFVIGGELNEIGTGAAWAEGEWLVVEADESDGTWLHLDVEVALVTSVEPDHVRHYGSFDALVEAAASYLDAATTAIVCLDDDVAARLAAEVGATTYGSDAAADYRIVDARSERDGATFRLVGPAGDLGTFRLPVPGMHNVRNAAGAIAAAAVAGASADAARTALGRFAGVARRFQFRGEAGGVTFVDDYAHLPTEAVAALAAARDGGWRRIVCVFQPHRYSRTSELWPTFADAFEEADLLVVTDVYAAGEQAVPGITGKLIVDAVLDAHPWRRVAYLPRRTDLVAYLERELRDGDLAITLGAGDVTSLADELHRVLEAR